MKREEIVRLMSDAAARQFIESVSPDASAEDKARWLDEGTMANIEGMEAALTALEARGLAVVSETRLRGLADVVQNGSAFSSKDRVVSHVVTEITAMLSASKDSGSD